MEEIRAFLGADSLHYLSYDGMIRATGLKESNFCTACFTGKYPIDICENAKGISWDVLP
jgi:amidophosphoribosyltransferase